MAASSPEGHSGDHRSLYLKTLRKDSFLLSKVFDIIDAKHPELLSHIAQRLSNVPRKKIRVSTKLYQDLTEIHTLTTLRQALQIGINLEMIVMFEYLFAYFSIINSMEEINASDMSPNPAIPGIRKNYKDLLLDVSPSICIQEMKHLSGAIDLLTSISGIPDLEQVQFPTTIGVTEAKADLVRLGLQSLMTFTKNEEPFSEDTYPPPGAALSDESGFVYYSISELYGAIYKGFISVHNTIGDGMFSLTPGYQAMITTFTTLDSALEAVATIQEQGEGTSGETTFDDLINNTKDWVISLHLPPDTNQGKIGLAIIALCDKILNTQDLNTLLPDILALIALINKLQSTGIQAPDSIIVTLNNVQSSHWGKFLMMLTTYSMLEKHTSSAEQLEANFSKPSYPRPDGTAPYNNYSLIVNNLSIYSFQLVLKILEGTILFVPPDIDKKFQITQRYTTIRFGSIMYGLIKPIGEILSYFQLNQTGTNKTAGFPFIPNIGELEITDPLQKFYDVVLSFKKLDVYANNLNDAFYASLNTCVGTWITDKNHQNSVVQSVTAMLKSYKNSVHSLYKQFTANLPPQQVKPAKEVLLKGPTPQQGNKDRYYLKLDFDGNVLSNMSNDPNLTADIQQGCKPFSRDHIPDKHYKGVKVKSATLVPPSYLTEEELIGAKFEQIQAAITEDFGTNHIDFRFNPASLENKSFHQINYEFSRQVGINPINIEFKTNSFDVTRADLLREEIGKEVHITQDGKNFSGQSIPDTLRSWKRRSDKILGEINSIVGKHKKDPLVSLIPTIIQHHPEAKLIYLALVLNVPDANDVNRLSNHCSRYLNLKEVITAGENAPPVGSSYHVPLNAAPADGLKSVNKTAGSGHPLSLIEFLTEEDWELDFSVGGVDYDALTFFTTGSLKIPLILNPPK